MLEFMGAAEKSSWSDLTVVQHYAAFLSKGSIVPVSSDDVLHVSDDMDLRLRACLKTHAVPRRCISALRSDGAVVVRSWPEDTPKVFCRQLLHQSATLALKNASLVKIE